MCRVMCLRVQVVPHGSLHELTLMDGVLCGETSLDRPGTLSEQGRKRESGGTDSETQVKGT